MHSAYVSSRLGIWKESGKFKLDMLLAKMGIPLKVCKQQFAHMGQEYKDLLALKLPEFAEEFGLTEVRAPHHTQQQQQHRRSRLGGAHACMHDWKTRYTTTC